MPTGEQWRPNPGPQTRFLASSADEALYGGAAGGGKSDALLMGALRGISEPSYRGALFRRTYPELLDTLVGKAQEWYSAVGGQGHDGGLLWTFPSGAEIRFRSMKDEKDKFNYKSSEFTYLAFDELTSFVESQYVYLLSRRRNSAGLRCFVRSGSNPGDVGHDWVLKRWAPWLYAPGVREDEYAGPYAAPGEVLWYHANDHGEQTLCSRGDAGAWSRTFIPALLRDNPVLERNDPGYRSALAQLDPVTRAQLEGGNWMIRGAPGEYFQRAWFPIVARGCEREATARVRWWDRAGSRDGDWTVGLLLARHFDGHLVVEDVVRMRGRPAEVQARIVAVAKQDALDYGAGAVRIVLAQDPGQAGVADVDHLVDALDGHDVHSARETGDKVTRCKPISAQAEAGRVCVMRAPWNESFFAELEAFPDGDYDDQVDALSGAHGQLARSGPVHIVTAGAQPLGGRAMGGF